MIRIYLVLLVVVLASCAPVKESHTETRVIDGPVVEVPVPAPSLTNKQDVQSIVALKNDFRLASGLLPLTEGLTCTIHNSSNPDLTVAFPGAVQTFTHFGEFNQPDASASVGTNVLPVNLRSVYVNNYLLRCQGQIVITQSGYYLFKLSSDDGSMLYIDNALTVNNNGNHGVTLVQNAKLLERGVHTIRLDYGQTGGGSQALILENSNGVIPSYMFYR